MVGITRESSRRTNRRRGPTLVERAVPQLGMIGDIDPSAWPAPALEPSVARAAHAGSRRLDPATSEGVRRRFAIDWQKLGAVGLGGLEDQRSRLAAELDTIGEPLLQRAFADDATWRDRIILVTSAGPGEGKTFTAVGLALSLARRNQPALLIDAGAGHTNAAAWLGLPPGRNLSHALMEPTLRPDQIVAEADWEGLGVATLEPTETPMTEFVASRRMVQLVRRLAEAEPRRLILIDGTPLLASNDAAVLAVIAGQTLLVVQAGHTMASAIGDVLDRLGLRQNLSLVLNRAAPWPGTHPDGSQNAVDGGERDRAASRVTGATKGPRQRLFGL